MGALRTKRAIRDRECGLLFSWRLPVGDHFRLGMAVVVVGLLASGLAASVRVRIGDGDRPIERRASMVIVPSGPEWRALEMRAQEAGPFPSRTVLSADPAYLAAASSAMKAGMLPGFRYEPEWIEVSPDPAPELPEASLAVLPPLPPVVARQAAAPAVTTAPSVLVLGGGARIESPAPPSPLAMPSRFLVFHLPDGRIIEVVDLNATAGGPDTESFAWLRRARVAGGAENGGWIAVELSP